MDMNKTIKTLNRLREQLHEVYRTNTHNLSEDRFFAIFLRGSQNYDLDDVESDIDSVLVVIPTVKEAVLNKKPINYLHVLENGEHVEVKDIRLYLKTLQKGNPSYLETLLTDFYIYNESYEGELGELHRIADKFIDGNTADFLNASRGIFKQKQARLEKLTTDEYTSKDWKELSHAIRMEYLVEHFLKNDTQYFFQLTESERTLLSMIKRHFFDIPNDSVLKYLKKVDEKINTLINEVKGTSKWTSMTEEQWGDLLDDMIYDLITKA